MATGSTLMLILGFLWAFFSFGLRDHRLSHQLHDVGSLIRRTHAAEGPICATVSQKEALYKKHQSVPQPSTTRVSG
ncbi:hypothetical protein BC940DRAFT_289195 [Gongronella butleri]|nr:hypothetical protein BC940DRAFT_289195 [Gongronella butleri]